MIINYCGQNKINSEIEKLWDQFNTPINDNLENGIKLLEQIKDIRRRMLL